MAAKIARRQLPTRDRILSVTRHLIQQRGYHGVGTAEILEQAKAPKGSMYHHFPDGKQQIAIAAVEEIRRDFVTLMDDLTAEQLPVADIIRRLAQGMSHWLKASAWREGTMLSSVVVGSVPDLPLLHAAIKETFDDWRQRLGDLLMREGWRKREARNLAHTIIAGMEGAMILARIDQDEKLVLDIAETLAAMVRR
jgi:TetR/AcrR family transcriptional regulator, lmrAB and yxaGH operons repressor